MTEQGVITLISERFGIEVQPHLAKKWATLLMRWMSGKKGKPPSQSYIETWLKVQTINQGLYSHGEQWANVDCDTCTLHIGYLGIFETAEQLERLRRPERVTTKRTESAARSKVFRTPLVPHPIDAVAQRVSRLH